MNTAAPDPSAGYRLVCQECEAEFDTPASGYCPKCGSGAYSKKRSAPAAAVGGDYWRPVSTPPKVGGTYLAGRYIEDGTLPRRFQKFWTTVIITVDGPEWQDKEAEYWYPLPPHPEHPKHPTPAAPVGGFVVTREADDTPGKNWPDLFVVRRGEDHDEIVKGDSELLWEFFAEYVASRSASPAAQSSGGWSTKYAGKNCREVPPGNGYCDKCAAGEYAQCRYITPAQSSAKDGARVDDAMIRRFVDALGVPYCFDAPPPGVIRAALEAAIGREGAK